LDALYDEHKLDLSKARAAIAVAEDAVRHVKGFSSETLVAELVQLRADIRRLRLKSEEGDEDKKEDAESLGCVAGRGSRRSFMKLQTQVQEANKQVAIAVKSEHEQALALEKTQKECNALRQECQRLQQVQSPVAPAAPPDAGINRPKENSATTQELREQLHKAQEKLEEYRKRNRGQTSGGMGEEVQLEELTRRLEEERKKMIMDLEEQLQNAQVNLAIRRDDVVQRNLM